MSPPTLSPHSQPLERGSRHQASDRQAPHPLLRYQHAQDHRVAEIDHYELDQLWSVTIIHSQERRVHGLYPSLASAQLILCALGFQRSEEAIA